MGDIDHVQKHEKVLISPLDFQCQILRFEKASLDFLGMKVCFGLVVVGRRSLVVLDGGSSFGSLVVRLVVPPFRLLVLEVCFLECVLRFNPILVQWPYGGTPLRAKPASMETFRGISLAHRIPFWATKHPMGLTKGKTQSDDQWPYGGTPLRASPKFSFLPFLLPLPYFSPGSVLKTP